MLRGSKASLKIIGIIPLGTDEGLSPMPVERRDRGPRKGNPQALLSARCGVREGRSVAGASGKPVTMCLWRSKVMSLFWTCGEGGTCGSEDVWFAHGFGGQEGTESELQFRKSVACRW